MTDLRTRNNAASKKSYEKALERQYAEDYEHEMIRQHMLTHTNTDAFHWSMVPEEWLYRAGYITDFNKHRHERLMRKKEKKEGENRVRDYGFDGISRFRDGDTEIYCGLQAKYYIEKQVCANDIGSFLAMQMALTIKNPLSKGYLYTSSKIQADLSGVISNPAFPIRHILFPWKHPDARISPKSDYTKHDCDKSLREDQKHVLKELEDKEGINSITAPCRWGKTIVACHHTKRISAKLVVAIAPLLISVENLQERLCCFLPNYTSLIVDSDNEGTTNVESIKQFLLLDDNKIIYSTFKSAIHILSENITDYDNTYILADEIHNATPKLCDFIQKFPKGLIMSATIPEEICCMLDINHAAYIPFSQAIRDNIVVDYTVWLPHLTKSSDGKTSVDVEIPIEFSSYDNELTAKAFYLATVMLKTGSRRCIAYLSRQEECDIFMNIVSQVFDIYHGLHIWTSKIDSTVSKEKRTEILGSFQNDTCYMYHILTSVRILDESVDIPRCDSVFVGYIGEKSSDIRMVQRSQRSATKDSTNPSKHNNIILWADEWKKCVVTLDLLREADPIFHKKIRIADSNYDKSGDISRIEEVAKSTEDWEKFETIQSLTREQTQIQLANQYITFYKVNGRTPAPKRNKDDDESKIERRLFYARKYWASAVNSKKKGYAIYESVKLMMDNEIPGWSDTLEEKQMKIVQKYIDFVITNKREPKKIEGEFDIYHGRRHWLTAFQGTGNHTLYPTSKSLLDEKHPTWCKNRYDTRQEGATKLVQFYQSTQRLPKYVADEEVSTEQKEENKLSNILQHFKKKQSDTEFKDIMCFLDENIPDWRSNFIETGIQRCKEIIQYHMEHGDFPPKDSDGGAFYKYIRSKIITDKCESPPYNTISKMLNEYYPDWRLTREELRLKEQNEHVEQIVLFFKANNRFPISNKMNKDAESQLGHKLILYRMYVNGKGITPISEENQHKLDNCSKLWRDSNSRILKTYIQHTRELKEFVKMYMRLPRQKGETEEETFLGRFLSKSKGKHKNGDLPEECRVLFEEIPGFTW